MDPSITTLSFKNRTHKTQNQLADLLSRTHELMETKERDKNKTNNTQSPTQTTTNVPVIVDCNANTKKTKTPKQPTYRKRTPTHRGEYEVDSVINKRLKKGSNNEYEYEIKWIGWNKTTWAPLSYLKNCMNKVIEYEQSLKTKQTQAVLQQEQEYQLPKLHICDVCKVEYYNLAQYYLHRSHIHNIPMPKTDHALTTIQGINTNTISTLQRSDKSLQFIYDSDYGEHLLRSFNAQQTTIIKNHEFILDEEGLLYICDLPTINSRVKIINPMKLVIPRTMIHRIIKQAHEGLLSCHGGINQTFERINQTMWWPQMRRDVCKYVVECEECQTKKRHKQDQYLHRPVPIAGTPFSRIGVDLIGPLSFSFVAITRS